MTEFAIAFEDVSRAEADRLAHELRREYAREGGVPERLTTQRTDAAAQGGLDLLWHMSPEDVRTTIEWTTAAVDVAAIVKGLMEICVRHSCAVRIRTPKGEIRVGKGEADWDKVRAYLVDVLNDGSKP